MLLDCLLELRAGEQSEHAVAESRGLGSLGFGFMTYDLRRLSRKYHEKAGALANSTGNLSAMAFARFALGFLDFYDGRWDEAESNLRAGGEGYHNSGDIRRWGGAMLMHSFVTSARGELEETLAAAAELERAGQDAADPQLTSWGFQVRAYAQIETGPLDEAIANMRHGVALAGKIHAWDNFLYQSSLLAKALVHQGRVGEAAEVVEEAFGVMEEAQLSRPFDRVEMLTAAAAVKLANVEASETAGHRDALREARTACRQALRAARVQTYWLPQTLRLCGVAEWLDGKSAAARKYWEESIAVAEGARFPLDHARTLMAMGSRTGDVDSLKRALALFEDNGARVGRAFALHALARARQQGSVRSDSLVVDYESAVRALEAVNAEINENAGNLTG
jgi:tetratricopeptide (TPR) repeat protein